ENMDLVPAGIYAAVGTGAEYARTLLDRYLLHMRGLNLRLGPTALLAIDIISQVKSVETRCGKSTDVMCFTDKTIMALPRNFVAEIETICDSFQSFSPAFLWNVVGAAHVDGKAELNQFRSNLKPYRHRINELCHLPQDSD